MIGEACDYDGFYGVEPGVVGCDLVCRSTDYLGDGSYCDSYFDCDELGFDEGDCLDTLDSCTLDDGSAGVYDCDVVCSADTTGDGTCDDAFNCSSASYDSGDCEAPGPGEECTYESFGYEYSGIVDCSGTCGSSSLYADGSYCDEQFNCEELGWDGGDCIDSGDACTLGDGSDGVYDCDMTCAVDTSGDDSICDDAFNCGAFDYDGGACEVESCFSAERDLGSVLGEGVASGDAAADFSAEDVYDGTCSSWGSSGTGEVLYGWTAPSTGDFCFDLLDSSFDTSLAVWNESCDIELACDGDGHGFSGGFTSYATVSLTEGDVVTVLIDSYSSVYSGDTYSLDITAGACP